jgi:hypothetical protein
MDVLEIFLLDLMMMIMNQFFEKEQQKKHLYLDDEVVDEC